MIESIPNKKSKRNLLKNNKKWELPNKFELFNLDNWIKYSGAYMKEINKNGVTPKEQLMEKIDSRKELKNILLETE